MDKNVIVPKLDTFIAIISFSNIGYKDEIKTWFENIRVIPSIVLFRSENKENGFYRITAMHELLGSPLPEVKTFIHVGFGIYDFLVQLLALKPIYSSNFYSYYPSAITYSQYTNNGHIPSGNRWYAINESGYLYLYHHTTEEGEMGILKENFIRPSKRNFAGTRILNKNFTYFTDIKNVDSVFDTMQILKLDSDGMNIIIRTDDETQYDKAKISLDNRKLSRKISLLINQEILQPNPMVRHFPFKSQPEWMEIMFPNIYRCPCDGIKIDKSIDIDGEKYWIVDINNVVDIRYDDPVSCANGNSLQGLVNLFDDGFQS